MLIQYANHLYLQFERLLDVTFTQVMYIIIEHKYNSIIHFFLLLSRCYHSLRLLDFNRREVYTSQSAGTLQFLMQLQATTNIYLTAWLPPNPVIYHSLCSVLFFQLPTSLNWTSCMWVILKSSLAYSGLIRTFGSFLRQFL